MKDHGRYSGARNDQNQQFEHAWNGAMTNWNFGTLGGDTLIGSPDIASGIAPGPDSFGGVGNIGLVVGNVSFLPFSMEHGSSVPDVSLAGIQYHRLDFSINNGTVDLTALLVTSLRPASEVAQVPGIQIGSAELDLETSEICPALESFPKSAADVFFRPDCIDQSTKIGGDCTTTSIAQTASANESSVVINFQSPYNLLNLGGISDNSDRPISNDDIILGPSKS